MPVCYLCSKDRKVLRSYDGGEPECQWCMAKFTRRWENIKRLRALIDARAESEADRD